MTGAEPATALVTGAAGFIGRGAVEALAEASRPWRVLPTDHIASGAQCLIGDLDELPNLLPAGFHPRAVVHCAGITTAACEADPAMAFRVNVDGTRRLLEWCRRLPRPARFVFVSSVAVFGGGEPAVDEASRVRPNSTYGAVKAAAEHLVCDAGRRGEIEPVVLRIPITIVRDTRIGAPGAGYLSDLIRHAAAGRRASAPLSLDRRLPIADHRIVFSAIARLAGTADAPALVHAPGAAVSGADVVAALQARGIQPRLDAHPDPGVERLIAGWPQSFESRLPAIAPSSLEDIIDRYLAGAALTAA